MTGKHSQIMYSDRIQAMPRWSHWLLPALSGLLLALSYPPYSVPFLVWVALIPLFLFLLNAKRLRDAFWGGAITGFLFLGTVLQWFFDTYPLDWAGFTPGVFSWFFVALVWLLSTLILAVFVALFSGTSYLFLKKSRSILTVIAIASLWPILEYLRAWGFGIFWWGKGAQLGPHWTWGWLSYATTNTPIARLASLFGELGLSFIITLVALLLTFLLITPKKWLAATIVIISIITATFTTTFLFSNDGESIDILLIQNDFPAGLPKNIDEITQRIEMQIDLITQSALTTKKPPDLIILPEGQGISWGISDNIRIAPKLLELLYGANYPTLIESLPIEDGGQIASEMYQTSPNIPTTKIYRKHMSIPFGEYVPAIASFFLKITGKKDFLETFNTKRSLITSPNKPEPAYTEHGIVGGLICSGVLSPSLNQHLVKKNAEILAVSSSYAVANGNHALLAQSKASAILKAITHQRYFVQATNAGISYIVAPDGSVPFISPERGFGTLRGQAKRLTTKTPATAMGDYVLFIFMGMIIVAVILQKRRDYLKKSKNTHETINFN